MDFSFLAKYWPYFLQGAGYTVALAFFTVIIGSIGGMLVALLRLSQYRILRFLGTTYVEIIRGTPLLVQIFIIFYGLPSLPTFMIGPVDMARFIPAIIALSINSAAYVGEIFRAGILAVDKGQMEAARSLGLPQGLAMRLVVLPQAIKNILPALGNEFVVVIKESSIVSVIGIAELMYNTGVVRGASFRPMEPLLVAAGIYFLLTFPLSKLMAYAERRMHHGH